MPVYEYEGKHYDLPDGLTNEQAKNKIRTHLGQKGWAEKNISPDESVDPLNFAKFMATDVVPGTIETMTTGVLDAVGGIGAQVYGAAKGALTPGMDMAAGRDQASEDYSKSMFHKAVAPQTATGMAVEEAIGNIINRFKDDAALLGTGEYAGADPNAPEWAKKARAMGAAVGSAIPEALTPMGLSPAARKPINMSKQAAKAADGVDLRAWKNRQDAKEGRTSWDTRRLDLNLDEGPNIGEKPLYVDRRGVARPDSLPPLAEQLARDRAAAAGMRLDLNLDEGPNTGAKVKDGRSNPLDTTKTILVDEQGQAFQGDINAKEVTTTSMVDNHPAVRNATEKLAKAEELLIKAAGMAEEGRVTASQMKRLEKDVKMFEQRLETARENVSKRAETTGRQTDPGGKTRGAINRSAFDVRDLSEDALAAAKELYWAWRSRDEFNGPEATENLMKFVKDNNVSFDSMSALFDSQMVRPKPSKAEFNLKALLQESMKPGTHLGAMGTDTYRPKPEKRPSYESQRFNVQDNAPSSLGPNGIRRGGPDRGAIDVHGFVDEATKLGRKTLDLLPKRGDLLSLQAGAAEKRKFEVSRVVEEDGILKVEGKFIGEDGKPSNRQFHSLDEDGNTFQYEAAYGKIPLRNFKELRALDNGLEAIGDRDTNSRMFRENDPIAKRNRATRGNAGAIYLGSGKGKQANALNKLPWVKRSLGTIRPTLWTPEEAIAAAKEHGSDVDQGTFARAINMFTKGGIYQADKVQHPIMKFAYDTVIEADRLARGEIQEWVHGDNGYASLSRNLSARELSDVWAMADYADKYKQYIDLQEAREAGANNKQIAWLEMHKKTMEKNLESMNRARAANGKAHITARQGYAAMSATGDFRRLVYDKQGGEIVGIIGSDFKRKTDSEAAALRKEGLFVGEEIFSGGEGRRRTATNDQIMNALELFAKDDPRIQQFLDIRERLAQNQANSFLNMKKHAEPKKGVFGMEGRKPWQDSYENAKDGVKAQVAFTEAALKWGHLSEAVEKLTPVLKDKSLNMPLVKEMAHDYMQNALGFNPSKSGQFLENAFSSMVRPAGIGGNSIRKGTAAARKVINTMLLTADPIHMILQAVQPLRALPGMKAFLDSSGINTRFDPTGYSYLFEASQTSFKRHANGVLTALEKEAYDYVKKNHVWGSDLVEHSSHIRKGVGHYGDKVAHFGTSQLEGGSRELTFLTFVHMLKDQIPKNELFATAANATDITLGNYSRSERPKIFNAAGPIGEMAVNLSSFKYNELSRLSMFARMAAKDKKFKPLAVELAASIAFAGVYGTAAFTEMDWIVRQITSAMGKPKSLMEMVLEFNESLPYGKHVLTHGLTSTLGVDMSKRMGMSVTPGSLMDVIAPGSSKVVKAGEAAYNMTTNPSEMNAKRLATEVVPRPFAQKLDEQWFTSQDAAGNQMSHNRQTLKPTTYMTESDKRARNWGLQGIDESVNKQKIYEGKWQEQVYSAKRSKVLAKMRDEAFAKNEISEKLIDDYYRYNGDPSTLNTDMKKLYSGQNQPEWLTQYIADLMSKKVNRIERAKRTGERMYGTQN